MMLQSKDKQYGLCLVLVIVLQVFALVVFMLGFFLTRQEVPHFSHCQHQALPIYRPFPNSSMHCDLRIIHNTLHTKQDASLWDMPIHPHQKEGPLAAHPGIDAVCWCKPRFKKVIIIVIDALRFDFVNPLTDDEYTQVTRPSKAVGYHLNKLPAVRELMESDPAHALLYRFEADPPTTTMQRLKGLTTGSLPTFIDFRKNFQSPAIAEDNLIRQFQQQGMRLTAMGDDTWQLLFPDAFNHSFPFPSFNTRDIDTVDNGILEHLMPEIVQGDWDVLIAHFLGVDHVGHTFGPSHPAMENKLTQMDRALREVLAALEKDSLLLVMGDHGMTDDGNHGGATTKETEAALFIHSKGSPLVAEVEDRLLLWVRDVEEEGSSSQGLYSHNLHGGAVPRRVAQVDLVPTIALLLGIAIPYANLGGIIPELFYQSGGESSFADLAAKFYANCIQVNRYLQKYAELASLPADSIDLLGKIFDQAIVHHHSAIELLNDNDGTGDRKRSEELLKQACREYRHFLDDALDLGRRVWTQYDVEMMLWAVALLLTSLLWCCCLVMIMSSTSKPPSIGLFNHVLPCGACGALMALVLSILFPSHFLADNRTLAIPCLVFSVLLLGISLLSGGLKMAIAFVANLSGKDTACLGLVILHGVSLFSNSYIEAEEKSFLFLASTSGAISFLATKSDKKKASGNGWKAFARQWYWLVPALLTRLAFEQKGHGQDVGAHFSIITTILPLVGILVYYHLQRRCISSSTLLGILYGLILIYWTSQADPQDTVWSDRFHLGAPRLVYALALGALLLRMSVAAPLGDTRKMVYPLFLDLAAITSSVIMLVLGPSSPLSFFCMMTSVINLHKAITQEGQSPSLLSMVITLSFYGRCYYYATGHHSQFNRLQYSAAFIGFDDFDFITGGVLLFMNTFGTEIVTVLLLAYFVPALSLSSSTVKRRAPSATSSPPVTNTIEAFAILINLSTFRTLLTTICVIIQRRHLMVWAIFAPKFIFDAALHVVLSAVCLIVLGIGVLNSDKKGRKAPSKQSTD